MPSIKYVVMQKKINGDTNVSDIRLDARLYTRVASICETILNDRYIHTFTVATIRYTQYTWTVMAIYSTMT